VVSPRRPFFECAYPAKISPLLRRLQSLTGLTDNPFRFPKHVSWMRMAEMVSRSLLLHRLVLVSLILISTSGLGCTSRQADAPPTASVAVSEKAININTATLEEFESLPGIGETLAKRIVDYRDRNGKFRRTEHLMLVPGVSERRFRQFRDRVRTD